LFLQALRVKKSVLAMKLDFFGLIGKKQGLKVGHRYMVVIHKKKNETPEEKEARKVKEQEKALGIQDEYQAKGFELMSWVHDHKVLVTFGIVTIIGIGIAWSAYSFYQRRMDEQASSAYINIVRKFENSKTNNASGDNKEIQKELSELVSRFKNTKVASLANLWAGHLALRDNDAKASVEFYHNALQNISSGDELYPLVLIGLGYAEESNGQKNEALSRFISVAELEGNNAGKDLALWEAARLAKENSDVEKAKTYINRLLAEFPSSVYEKNATRLRESL
jgi:predicted negative regulator of RcsB-dependent stress response